MTQRRGVVSGRVWIALVVLTVLVALAAVVPAMVLATEQGAKKPAPIMPYQLAPGQQHLYGSLRSGDWGGAVSSPGSGLHLSTGPVELWADDMESGTGGWTAEGTWAITEEWSASPTHSWSDSPDDSYLDDIDSSLTSEVIDLGSIVAGKAALFEFNCSGFLEAEYDVLLVEFSGDGGTTWKFADALTGALPGGALPVDALPDSYSTFVPWEVLTDQFRFRLRLVSDFSETRDGVHIDDVAVFAVDLPAPTIESVRPLGGSVLGGTEVTILGAGFSRESAVTFGGTSDDGLTAVSPSVLIVTSPAHDAGSVQVQVTTGAGFSADTATDDYLYVGVGGATVTSVDPARGGTAGEEQVMVYGTGFEDVMDVTFGGRSALYFEVDPQVGTSLMAVSPAHAVGTVNVQVVTAAGMSADTPADNYTYVGAPTVTGLSVSMGDVQGGTEVVIAGTDFTDAREVTFGPFHRARFAVDSDSQITATTPAYWWPGTVQVQVTGAGGLSEDTSADDFAYTGSVTAEAHVTSQLTEDAYYYGLPQVSGDRVVWSDGDVFTWTPAGGVVQISTTEYDDLYPRVSGDRVVWVGGDGGGDEVFTWTPTGGVVKLTEIGGQAEDFAAQVSGDRVVWFNSGVWTWTPTGGAVELRGNGAWNPQVSGNRVVWQEDTGPDLEIFTWTSSGGVVRLTNNSTDEWDPQVSGDRVVWEGTSGSDVDVFTWTPTGGTVRLTDDTTFEDGGARVSGDRVVWVRLIDELTGESEVFTWTPAGGTVQVAGPDMVTMGAEVSGDRVVWASGTDAGEMDFEILTWTPFTGLTVLSSPDFYRESSPQISGGRVVWAGAEDSGEAIFTATVESRPTVTSVSPSVGPIGGGTSVTVAGTMLTAAAAVTFGGVAATSFTVDSPTQVTATAPVHAAGPVSVRVTGPGGLSVDTPDDDFTYLATTRYQQTDSRLTYLGAWSYSGTWSASGGSLYSAGTSGAAVLVNFNGTAVSLIAKTTPWYGKALVSLDGGSAEYVDFYSAASLYKRSVYAKTGLAPGGHTLVVRCAGEKNPLSSGLSISLDAVDVLGTLGQAPLPTRYQQDDVKFKYMGVWAPTSTWSASGGSFASVDAPGSALNVTFDGRYLAWCATTGRAYGKAQVSLDGGAPVLVDFYSSYTRYKQRVYNTGLLDDNGPHTLSIYWVGQKNAAATATRISADTFDILGTASTTTDPDPILWRYQQTDTRLTYLGVWSYGSTWSASGGSFNYTAATGAAAVVDFTGTSVKLMATTGPGYGKALVSLDGAPGEEVDFYSPTTLYKQSVYEKPGLAAGSHIVTIRCQGDRNVASSGYSISLDALDITGCLTQAAAPTRYQQENAKLRYVGAWSTTPTWLASGGSLSSADVSGAQVTVSFTGSYLAWYAKTAPWYGKATVTLDGGTPFEVDLYGAAQLYKQRVYNTGLLADDGDHILLIEWSGLKRAASAGTTIDVDTFDILGTLRDVTP
jgi:hypothetical protein